MKETKIISIQNQKGGTGKTTSTFNIGVALQQKGFNTLMVDLDPQINLTTSVALNPINLDSTVVDIFDNPNRIVECIYELEGLNGLSIIASHPYLSGVEVQIINKMGREGILSKALNIINGLFDFILIDCPPQLSLLSINALVASDYLLVPTETTPLSFYALDKLLEVAGEVKDELNPKLELLGIIATMYDKRIRLDNEVLNTIKDSYEVLGVVKRTVKARIGISKGIPVIVGESKSDIALSYREIANKIIEKTVRVKGEFEVC